MGYFKKQRPKTEGTEAANNGYYPRKHATNVKEGFLEYATENWCTPKSGGKLRAYAVKFVF